MAEAISFFLWDCFAYARNDRIIAVYVPPTTDLYVLSLPPRLVNSPPANEGLDVEFVIS